MTGLLDDRMPVDIVCLDLEGNAESLTYKILMEKWMRYELDERLRDGD